MKLTEKELNEFPIGTKIKTKTAYEIIKTELSEYKFIWYNAKTHEWYDTNYWINNNEIKKVELPTYTEYILPKPILDEKEKEYLSSVIRPFSHSVKTVQKIGCLNEYEYIHIEYNDGGFPTDLKVFKKGTKYKGMELDKEYTLEELEL